MALRPTVSKTIAVTGGAGQITFDGDGWAEDVGIISPDNTPRYDFDLYNGSGQLLTSARRVDAQYARIVGGFKAEGICTAKITSAADNGSYLLEVYIR